MTDSIQEAVNAKDKLDGLVKVVDTQSMSRIGDYIDSLTQTECKWVLKMIAYGGWKDFDRE